MTQGLHLTADLRGCASDHPWMTCADALRQACLQAVTRCGLHPVGECFHRFPSPAQGGPGGVTGMVLLAESHLAVHTWPESGLVTLDVFVCNLGQDNRHKAWALREALLTGFAPAQASLQALDRGLPAAAST